MSQPAASSAAHVAFLSSGDAVLDRRREWALAASEDGFHQAAAEIYEQIIERAPHWVVAWYELGAAREKCGDGPGAIAAFEAVRARDDAGILGADLRLAALGASPAPASASAAYVRGLFDQYAGKFDEHLVQSLDYRGPELLRDALKRACAILGREYHFDYAYDLGCGTGLMAMALWKDCDVIDGVDLSPKMIEAARATGVYHDLFVDDVVAFLNARNQGDAQLVIAADVFVYMGDLAPLFAAATRAMEPGSLLAFSVQEGEGADFAVGSDMRFTHSAAYLRRLASAHGLEAILLEQVSTRKDRGAPVPGLLAVMAKQA